MAVTSCPLRSQGNESVLDPGQGRTRWALEQTAMSLRRHIPHADDERRKAMEAELVEIEDALDEDEHANT